MDVTVGFDTREIARRLRIPVEGVTATVELLDDENTVPFITRYRKDRTGGLNEEQITQIQSALERTRSLNQRKETILKTIETQEKLTPELAEAIRNCRSPKLLEDLYLPFKRKKQSRASIAQQRGLEPFSQQLFDGLVLVDRLEEESAALVDLEKGLPSTAEVLSGVGDLLAERISEMTSVRRHLREVIRRHATLVVTRLSEESEKHLGAESKVTTAESSDVEESSNPSAEGTDEIVTTDGVVVETDQNAASENADVVVSIDATTQEEAVAVTDDSEPSDAGPREGVSAAADSADTSPDDATSDDVAPGDATSDDATSDDGTSDDGTSDDGTSDDGTSDDGAPDDATSDDGAPDDGELQDGGVPDGTPDGVPGGMGPHEGVSTDTDSANTPPDGTVSQDLASSDGAADEVSSDDQGSTSGPSETSPAVDGASRAEVVESEDADGAPDSRPMSQVLAAAPAVKLARSIEQAKRKEALQRREQRRDMRKRKRMKLEASFADYFDYREKLSKIPPHRILAINRGERTRVVRVKLELDSDQLFQEARPLVIPSDHPQAALLEESLRDALTRLLIPSLERGIRREMTEKAEQHALDVFARNLRKLFIQPPVRKRVLAIDPGFRTGCKIVALDEFGSTLDHTVVHIIGDESKLAEGRKRLADLVRKHDLHVVAIGNGTACREAEAAVAQIITDEFSDGGLAYVIVNEAGASVYSTSALAREELPDYDATLRGAISIGRRLQDPLSELVKIHPSNIGVGMYQHDVKTKPLRDSLNAVVESCVNYVGVNLNAASPALLRYVSGLNQLTARRIYEYRQVHGPFRSREELKEVPGIGEATFVQSAGFLKIVNGDNPWDATWIHPESYNAAQTVLAHLQGTLEDLVAELPVGGSEPHVSPLAQKVRDLNVDQVVEELSVGRLLLRDILDTLQRPGRDPREDLPPPIFRSGVVKLEDLQPGMELSATVLNVVDFGAFVDIGLPDSGLVHISRLADRYISDPHDVVSVGDVLHVWVVEIDKQRRRVSLTAIKPGSEKPRGVRHSNRPSAGRPQAKKPWQRGPKRTGGGGKSAQDRPRRPRKPPAPVVPITPEMQEGKKPMRTFSDLLQFYDKKKEGSDGGAANTGEKPSK